MTAHPKQPSMRLVVQDNAFVCKMADGRPAVMPYTQAARSAIAKTTIATARSMMWKVRPQIPTNPTLVNATPPALGAVATAARIPPTKPPKAAPVAVVRLVFSSVKQMGRAKIGGADATTNCCQTPRSAMA